MSVRIAVVQMETKPGAVQANLDKALSFAAEALREAPDLILFQEELLTGCVPNVKELCQPVDGPATQAFQKVLKGTETLILFGLNERQGEDCFIAATLVAAGGVCANYHKTHLWWASKGVRDEVSFYRPGEKLVTFDVRGHKSGVMICYDGDFPEMARSYANLDCVMLFWLNLRGSRGPEEVRPLVRQNTIIMATSCGCGLNEAGAVCRGGSHIMDRDGAVRAELWDREGVIHASVDPTGVLAARQENIHYKGQRRDLYC